MLKRIVVLALSFALTAFVHADEAESITASVTTAGGDSVHLSVSAEMKTGVFWDSRGVPAARIHHNDDAGTMQGRLRLGMRFQYENVGVRVRFQQDGLMGSPPVVWDFAYAYGSFLNDQLRFSLGRLGESPWEWGGSVPRWLWVPHDPQPTIGAHRLRLDDLFGIRTEIRPAAVPGLSVGFTLNEWDGSRWTPPFTAADVLLQDFLMETTFGVAYENENIYARFSFRLDSEVDDMWCAYMLRRQQEGHSLMYRIEPRIVGNFVPHLSVWLNGWWRGIGAGEVDTTRIVEGVDFGHGYINTMMDFRNWLYIEYAPPLFTAELRVGAQITGFDSHVLSLRPSFFYNVLPFLRLGSAFRYELNFGSRAGELGRGRPFPLGPAAFNPPEHFFAVEPQLRVHFGQTYIAFVYGFEGRIDDGNLTQRHWINLRTVVSF